MCISYLVRFSFQKSKTRYYKIQIEIDSYALAL